LFIQYNSEWLRCDSAGQKVYPSTAVEYGYYLTCPDPIDFCNEFYYRCPLDCSGNGICLYNGQCQCFFGFSGQDCAGFNAQADISHAQAINTAQHHRRLQQTAEHLRPPTAASS
jgi:hypothetical protein